jgi:hypothetical protein
MVWIPLLRSGRSCRHLPLRRGRSGQSRSCRYPRSPCYPPGPYSSYLKPQGRQSTRNFLPVVQIGILFPAPSSAGECNPSPFGSQGGHTRVREKGWEVPIQSRGQTLWRSRYIKYTLCMKSNKESCCRRMRTRRPRT